MSARWGPILLWVALLVFPGVVEASDSATFYQDVGANLILAAIGASAWNIVGGYAGQVSVGHTMFFDARPHVPLLIYNISPEAPPPLRFHLRIPVSVPIAVTMGTPRARQPRARSMASRSGSGTLRAGSAYSSPCR